MLSMHQIDAGIMLMHQADACIPITLRSPNARTRQWNRFLRLCCILSSAAKQSAMTHLQNGVKKDLTSSVTSHTCTIPLVYGKFSHDPLIQSSWNFYHFYYTSARVRASHFKEELLLGVSEGRFLRATFCGLNKNVKQVFSVTINPTTLKVESISYPAKPSMPTKFHQDRSTPSWWYFFFGDEYIRGGTQK